MFERKFIFGNHTKSKREEYGDYRDCKDGKDYKDSREDKKYQQHEDFEIFVGKMDWYTSKKGYGFLGEQNRKEEEELQFYELCSGFEPYSWYQDEAMTEPKEDENGCFLDSDEVIQKLEEKNKRSFEGENRRIPLSFRAAVPTQGNYKVTLTIKTEKAMTDVLIFTGRRRLGWRGDIAAGSVWEKTFSVNVCDIIPRGEKEIFEGKAVDITVVADQPRITEIQLNMQNCPTVYIAGDSTVTDQRGEYPYTPGTCYSGWGQMLTAYMDERIALSNHAHSGLTTESFREEGHYSIVQQYWKSGDYYLMQFGHNDQKLEHLQAKTGYRENLIRYIKESREAGVYPVLITSVARNTWKEDGTYNDLLKEHADACIQIGQEMDVPVLDLHKCSMELIKQKGMEAMKPYFYEGDFTHSNDYGAYMLAGFVAGEIRRVCHGRKEYQILADCITKECGKWELPNKIIYMKKPDWFEERE